MDSEQKMHIFKVHKCATKRAINEANEPAYPTDDLKDVPKDSEAC